MSQYWSACQVMPGREHVVRAEIEKGERGAFVPTYARAWFADGKVSAGERAAMQGYVFFRTRENDWGSVADIDGVQRVLTMENGDRPRLAKRVSDADMARMVIAHATGQHNRIEACIYTGKPKERQRRRRPRPGNRIRKATERNRTDIGT